MENEFYEWFRLHHNVPDSGALGSHLKEIMKLSFYGAWQIHQNRINKAKQMLEVAADYVHVLSKVNEQQIRLIIRILEGEG